MFFDARSLSPDEILEADLCIVGAGPAGIAISLEFAKSDIRVILLESGGLKFNHRTQFLNKGEISGRKFTSLEFTRRRQFGGSTVTWFGRCRPLDESDFAKRKWMPHSGWPIDLSELRPFYERANRLFELGEYRYEADYWDANESYRPPAGESTIESKIFHFSPPTRFGERYGPELQRARNVRVFMHANATWIQLNRDGQSVAHIQCATLQKKSFRVKARCFALSLGGLETTRLMLASRDVHLNGVGNQHDLLGRFFLEHAGLFDGIVSDLPPAVPASFFKLDYSIPMRDLGMVRAIGLTEKYRQQHHLLNGCAFFVKRPAHKTDDIFFSIESQDYIHISEMLHHTTAPSPDIFKSLGRSLRNSRLLLPVLWKMPKPEKQPVSYGLQMQLECVPNPDSRVMLSNRRDALGMNQIKLDWRLTRQDQESYSHFREALFNGLERSGFKTRLINHGLDAEGWPVSIVPIKHHSGTTRMHRDPRHGVVDADCRVHEMSNLYIASSSVFPTSGMANPTLTILALALRLADHIKKELQV